MSYCPNCGVNVSEGVNFCPGCGIAVSASPISCPKCGINVGENMRFCTRCGTEVSYYCSKCGSRISPVMMFCGKCGQPRMKEGKTTSTSPTPSRVEGYGRQAVIVGEAEKNHKDTGIALGLGLVAGFLGFWGLGHIYVGRIERGLLLLLIGLLINAGEWVLTVKYFWDFGKVYYHAPNGGIMGGVVVLGLLDFILWIWQSLDARHVCQTYNRTL